MVRWPRAITAAAYSSDDLWGADYVDAAHDVLGAAACGWIVDLRSNGGGNLYPMLAALAPLLGPGPLLGYRDRHGRTDSWVIDDDGTVVADGWPAPHAVTPSGSLLARRSRCYTVRARPVPVKVS